MTHLNCAILIPEFKKGLYHIALNPELLLSSQDVDVALNFVTLIKIFSFGVFWEKNEICYLLPLI